MKDAVARTLRAGGAEVEVVARSTASYGGNGNGELRLAGRIDFAGGRTRLDGASGAVVCDGPTQYSELRDGRWTSQGEDGQWSNVDPRWSLEVLARCSRDVREVGERRFEMAFDTDGMRAITHAGLASGWQGSGRAELDAHGRVTRVEIHLREDAGALDWELSLSGFGSVEAIELPPRDRVIALDDYVAEIKRHSG